MKSLALALVLSLAVSPVLAAAESDTGNVVFSPSRVIANGWASIGVAITAENDPQNQPHIDCTLHYDYPENDGSLAEITKNDTTGEIYFYFHNTDWNINVGEDRVPFKLDINGYLGRKVVKHGSEMNGIALNKNTIVIPDINADDFIGMFQHAEGMQLIMPNNIANISLSWGNDGTKLLNSMATCLATADRFKKGTGEFKSETPKPPVSKGFKDKGGI